MTLSYDNDTIFVTATCDSLMRECYTLEEELSRYRSATTKEAIDEKITVPVTTWMWKSFWVGIIVGVIGIMGVIMIIKTKRWQE